LQTLPTRARALLTLLRELAVDGTIERSRAQLARELDQAASTFQLAVRDLVEAGLIDVELSPGKPARYKLTDLTDHLTDHLTDQADRPDRADLTDRPDRADRPSQPVSRAGDRPVASNHSGLAGNGSRRAAPASATPGLAREGRLTDPDLTGDDVTPTPNPSGAAISAAVDEARRLGKPELDEATKKRIGSVAKRMHRDGVTVDELVTAAKHLAAKGLTDLLVAHRSALESSATPAPVDYSAAHAAAANRGPLPSAWEVACELWRRGGRLPGDIDSELGFEVRDELWPPITLAEAEGVLAYMRSVWRSPPRGDAAGWEIELRGIPQRVVLTFVRAWGRRDDPESAWPPTVLQIEGQVRARWNSELGRLGRAWKDILAEWEKRQQVDALGDPSDPRLEG
jgi:hypothetical protein